MLLSLVPERPKTGEVLYGLKLLAGVLGVDRLGDVRYIVERAESDIVSWESPSYGAKELPMWGVRE